MSPTTRDPRATVTEMWRTRPTRRQGDRKLAGVAAAIARRYDVDPVLVRIGFVVAAFYGVGILLYLFAWVALDADPNDPPRGPIANGAVVRVLVYVLLVIATVYGIHVLLNGDLDVLVGLLVVGGLLYLLQISRGERGLGSARAEQPPGDPSAASGGPGPAPAPAPGPTGPRSRVTPVTIAAALLAAGVTGVLLLLGVGLPGPRLVVGVLLAVVGVGLLVGSFAGGGRGLVLLAVPLLLVGYGVTRAPFQHWRGAGELRVAPTVANQLAPSYERSFGQIDLDLRRLDLSAVPAGQPGLPGPPAPEPVRTRVTMGAGQIVVRLPPNVDARVHCHADYGDVHCLGDQGRGPDNTQEGPTADAQVNDPGADGVTGGTPLELDLSVGTGEVEVRRG